MKHLVTGAALAALLGYGGIAVAQTSGADGGDPAVTEPGGTMGRDGAQNIREGIRDGEAVGVPRGTVVDEGQIYRRDPAELPHPERR